MPECLRAITGTEQGAILIFSRVDVLNWAATRINVYSHHVLRYGKRCVLVSCNARNERGETGFLCLKFAKKLKEQSVCHLLAPIGTAS